MSTLQRGADRLAKIIGHMIIRLVLITITAVVVVALGSTMGIDGYVSGPAPTPAAATPAAAAPAAPVADTSGMAEHPRPTDNPPAAATPAEDAVRELASGRPVLVGLRSDETPAAVWFALIAEGWKGQQGDHTDDVVYAPVGMIVDTETGSWRVSLAGVDRVR